MIFKVLPLGPLGTNCYLLSNGGHAVIIDPAEDGTMLARLLQGQDLILDAICLTHAHYDHIGGLKDLQEATGAVVYLHPGDLDIAPVMSQGLLTVKTQAYPEILRAGGLEFQVFHTPGHSPGSVCLKAEDKLFTGDTLFCGSCGRTDFPGGSWEEIAASLRFLYKLEGNPAVYPGHGESSCLDMERKYNPYLREAMQA